MIEPQHQAATFKSNSLMSKHTKVEENSPVLKEELARSCIELTTNGYQHLGEAGDQTHIFG